MSNLYNSYMKDKEILKEIGNNIRAERNRKGLSQEKLAELTGISYGQVIGTIERGEINTSILFIIKIMKILNIDFEKIYSFKN